MAGERKGKSGDKWRPDAPPSHAPLSPSPGVGRPVANRPASTPPPRIPPIRHTPQEEVFVGEEAAAPARRWLQMPAWLLSLIVHLAVLLVLLLFPVQQVIDSALQIVGSLAGGDADGGQFELSPDMGDQLEQFEAEVADAQPLEVPLETGLMESIALPKLDLPVDATASLAGLKAISMGFAGRAGQMRSALLESYGGTQATEAAVARGLSWLVKQQRSDGSWSLRGPYEDGGVNENIAAATAMALLAFAGAGNTHQEGQYKEDVDEGLRYLLKLQSDDGFFAAKSPDRQRAYAQAQCTIVLCELLAMSKDPALREPAQRAIDYAIYAQSPQGGWRYYPREDSDLSVTGWYVMALISGQMAGLTIDSEVMERVTKFLNEVQVADGALYRYVAREDPKLSMTAEGLLCREYLGWAQDDPRLQQGISAILMRKVDFSGKDRESPNYYYWYYATQALHHAGGDAWTEWNNVMREALPAAQVKGAEGEREAGSWDPKGDPWGVSGGRLYSTCFAIYCLEVYYRHLPIYDFR